MSEKLLKNVLQYAERGWQVLPVYSIRNGRCSCGDPACNSPGKHPRTYTGFKEATTDQGQLERWWATNPDANVGIRTGPESGIWVLDLDGKEGIEALKQLEEKNGQLPKTVSAKTGGGGCHFYFKYPSNLVIKNRTKIQGLSIDVRGDGGYVVAPPSNHVSGNAYQWENPPENAHVAEPPAWLLDFIGAEPKERPQKEDWLKTHCGELNFKTAPGVREGQRHALACQLVGAHLGRGEDPLQVFSKGKYWARKCSPPMDEAELLRIISDLAKKGQGQAQRLIVIGEQSDLFQTPEGEAFATFPVGKHRETWPIKSKAFRRWLQRRFRQQTRKVPTKENLSSGIEMLEAMAFDSPNKMDVHIRVAEHEGNIYLDLCNDPWEVVQVSREGWQVGSNPPVKFRRSKGMLPLPTPERGGSLELLREMLHVEDEAWALILGWLVSALRPSGSHPVALLCGEQGAGKSTNARTLRALVDPNVAPLRSQPKNPHDLMIAAINSWASVFDNLSSVQQWFSDALCRLSTGGGFATRQLYTDTDEIILQARRPIILTSIGQTATRPDLLDRCVIISLPPLQDTERRPEADYWREFETRAPKILGALLDGVSHGLANLGNIPPTGLPRMADFAQWAMAAEAGLGLAPGAFLAAYTANRGSANRLALDASAIAKPLMTLIDKNPFEGTASDLLRELTCLVGEGAHGRKDWPKTAQVLATELITIAPLLRQEGYQVEQDQTSGTNSRKLWRISKAGG